MENVKQKIAELCEAVAAKGGNVMIIGDVKDDECAATICQMRGKVYNLAMDMARVARQKDSEPIRGILDGAKMMLDIIEDVTKEAIVETTEE